MTQNPKKNDDNGENLLMENILEDGKIHLDF